MATDLKPAPDTSVTELVTGILHDAQDLIKQQFELLKHEVREDIRKTRDASLLIGAGGIVGLVGAIHVTLMLVYLLHWATNRHLFVNDNFPLWACFGICGLLALVIGGGLIYAGMNKFASFNPLPDQSAQALKENVQWITQPK